MGTTPYSEPSSVSAEQGIVFVDGPDGVAFALTPGAAEETGRRLVTVAQEAREQSSSDEDPD